MSSSKRVETDILEWVKLIFEFIYGCLLSLFYIIMEVVELIVPTKSKSLTGQHVLVTGAGRGLGREICLRLVQEGVKLTCVDVSLATAEETAALCNATRPGCAAAAYCDIADKHQVSKLAEQLPPVDILINNAGIVSSASVLEVTEEHIERLMQVNILAQFWTIRAFLPGMIARGRGHVVGMASAASFTAAANIALYAASKYAVAGMMSSLREEFRHFHPEIKTTTVHPFFITPPPSSVEHWDKTSRIPDVSAVTVAEKTVEGIKKDKVTVTVPSYLYFLLLVLQFLPSSAGEYWRDMFYAKINPLEKRKTKAT
ncbi:epidermal retinol dehydrogenase 2 [Halyomorpha halys]|uniref:epidermal retinol dehydrogenase 2 n=1 Tax=Halyomorpha halys TaxID=286706 RepID=UPI0034D37379